MASLKYLLDLVPEGAGQTDVEHMCAYDPGQGTEVIEPFQVQSAGLFFAQAPRHEL